MLPMMLNTSVMDWWLPELALDQMKILWLGGAGGLARPVHQIVGHYERHFNAMHACKNTFTFQNATTPTATIATSSLTTNARTTGM